MEHLTQASQAHLIHRGGELPLRQLLPQVQEVVGEDQERHLSPLVWVGHHLVNTGTIWMTFSLLMQKRQSLQPLPVKALVVKGVPNQGKAMPQTHHRQKPVQDDSQEHHKNQEALVIDLKVIIFFILNLLLGLSLKDVSRCGLYVG